MGRFTGETASARSSGVPDGPYPSGAGIRIRTADQPDRPDGETHVSERPNANARSTAATPRRQPPAAPAVPLAPAALQMPTLQGRLCRPRARPPK